MPNAASAPASPPPSLDRLWFTRCPVPTASGLAYKLGWLQQEFAADGIRVDTLQDARELGRHHYDHELPGLIREGGNVPALAARAAGSPTRLIGLTWIEEWQTILVRRDAGISRPADLKGKRLALPAWSEAGRPGSFVRAMSLHGYSSALKLGGLDFDDVQLVEVPLASLDDGPGPARIDHLQRLWSGLDYLVRGEVDAVYVKGGAAADAARRLGLVVGIDLDLIAAPRYRINNGTPRPITVHQRLLDEHFDLVVRFLAQTLLAADWARDNLGPLRAILAEETASEQAGIEQAYRGDFHASLHPDLSAERLEYLALQKNFLYRHGFLERDFELAGWADPRPLQAAHELIARRHGARAGVTHA
ncbi:ABC transporter substrate-binding protein [Pseudomonas sichuanensis]|uniref:ABC transporter substrate-binding protein n=1 Tax=Pseudomonas TaxID=286 RepID=UPI0036E31F52